MVMRSMRRKGRKDTTEDAEWAKAVSLRMAKYLSTLDKDALNIYRQYIGSRLWVRRKEAYYATHPKACAICKHPRVELNHIYYGNYGLEKDEDLIPLCRSHHEALHREIGVHKDMRYATADFIEWQRHLIEESQDRRPRSHSSAA
jgi:hypothetical protein